MVQVTSGWVSIRLSEGRVDSWVSGQTCQPGRNLVKITHVGQQDARTHLNVVHVGDDLVVVLGVENIEARRLGLADALVAGRARVRVRVRAREGWRRVRREARDAGGGRLGAGQGSWRARSRPRVSAGVGGNHGGSGRCWGRVEDRVLCRHWAANGREHGVALGWGGQAGAAGGGAGGGGDALGAAEARIGGRDRHGGRRIRATGNKGVWGCGWRERTAGEERVVVAGGREVAAGVVWCGVVVRMRNGQEGGGRRVYRRLVSGTLGRARRVWAGCRRLRLA